MTSMIANDNGQPAEAHGVLPAAIVERPGVVSAGLPEIECPAIGSPAESCNALVDSRSETRAPSPAPRARRSSERSGKPSSDAPGSPSKRRTSRPGDAGFTLERGTRVGRYAIEAPLGTGGMSVVYSAIDTG